MFRLFSLERGRQKQRLELSLAGICELELLKRRHEALIVSALALHAPEPEPEPPRPKHTQQDSNPGCPPVRSPQTPNYPTPRKTSQASEDSWWNLLKILQHQVGDFRVSAGDGLEKPLSDTADGRLNSDSSGPAEISPWAAQPVRIIQRIQSADEAVPRSLAASLEGITEDRVEEELWTRQSVVAEHHQPTREDTQPQHVETYILELIRRSSIPVRVQKAHSNPDPEDQEVNGQSSANRPDPLSPERRVWGAHSVDNEHYGCSSTVRSAGICSTSLDRCNSETESPVLADELVSAQYIPAQPSHAHGRASLQPPLATYSPDTSSVKPRTPQKKSRPTEDKATGKKPGRKACRAHSENSLPGQRVSERRCNTVERDPTRRTRRHQGGATHGRWSSTVELSQDETENQPIRRTRKPLPAPVSTIYTQPPPNQRQLPYPRNTFPAESESSLSEPDSAASSSLSSDSDESGGLVWPQQLPPQAPPSPSSPPGSSPQPKAFVKIKASHALKKKILRFRTGSLKVMTTV